MSNLPRDKSDDAGQLRLYCLAFLAERAPRRLTAQAIRTRLIASTILDAVPTQAELNQVLVDLQKNGAWVEVEIEPVTKEVLWYATDAGKRQWVLDGQPQIGGKPNEVQ